MDGIGIHSSIITHILIHLVGLYLVAFAQDDYWSGKCLNVSATKLSLTNRDQVLNNLTSSSANITYGFTSFTAGQSPDVVNGIALCRADIEHDKCVACLGEDKRRLRGQYPDTNEAIGWYDNCMLRYSNRSIFNTVETDRIECFCNPNHAPNKDLFIGVLGPLLSRIAAEAAAGVGGLGKFATREEKVTGPGMKTTVSITRRLGRIHLQLRCFQMLMCCLRMLMCRPRG